jgi:hypothetical protein
MTAARLLILAFATASSASFAEDAPSIPPYELKNRSTFTAKAGTRVPFWPIGWNGQHQPIVTPGKPMAKAFQIQPSHFTVTSILLSHPPLATINGRAFGEGEFLPVEAGGQPVKVIVTAIRDGGVWLDQSGHQIFVPMRRQELAPRSAPEVQQGTQAFTIKIEEKK